MSTSYKSSRSGWSVPITSALLDAMMSSSSTEQGSDKTSDKKSTSQTSCVRTSASTFNENDSKCQSDKKAQPEELHKERTSERKCRDSGYSSVYSQGSTTPRNGSSLSSSTPRSKSWSPITMDANTSVHSGRNITNSSVSITPENTPNKFSTPEVKINTRRPFKRSFEHSDQSLGSNSSAFYTPDSSPNEYGSSVKRFKSSRWRDSRSWYSSPDTSLSGSPSSRYTVGDSESIQPELIGYQMVGDSQFCRFGQQLLGLHRIPTPNSSGRIGICVSGQTITDLHNRVKDNFYPISDKIILMIGTNDFLRSVDVRTMCKELSSLLTTLQETAKNIVLLTLPPIPRLEKKQREYHFTLLEQYNEFIRSLANGEQLKIADVSPLYMTSSPFKKCRMNYFELYFHGPQQRMDMIHLNHAGLEVIRKYILDNFIN